MPGILIVDGHAYAYRAFYAIRSLNSPTGRPTNSIYGFVKMLAKMRAKIEPSHLVVVWDGGLSAARQLALPEYKAQRPEMPDALREQLDEIGRYLGAANVASFCRDGVEADDYIALVVQEARKSGLPAVIASADKDFMQLVGPGVGLLNPNDKSEAIWGIEQVRAKAGVLPEQIVDWLSLLGDAVDNIPGVPGVGTKTATELMTRFGSVAELYRRLDEVKSGRIRSALREAEPEVRRNQSLVRLNVDLACECEIDSFAVKPADAVRLGELFRAWGFRGMLAELAARQPQQADLI